MLMLLRSSVRVAVVKDSLEFSHATNVCVLASSDDKDALIRVMDGDVKVWRENDSTMQALADRLAKLRNQEPTKDSFTEKEWSDGSKSYAGREGRGDDGIVWSIVYSIVKAPE